MQQIEDDEEEQGVPKEEEKEECKKDMNLDKEGNGIATVCQTRQKTKDTSHDNKFGKYAINSAVNTM